MRETLRATEVLVEEGFEPMVYCVDDPIAAKQLEEAGAVAIMPLGAPIGSGLGIQNRVTIRLIVEGAKVPVLVDAGVGTASDAALAMELGCDGVLMNTAIAEAKDPVLMARAMKGAVEAGRLAYLAGAWEAPLRRSFEPAGGAYLKGITRHVLDCFAASLALAPVGNPNFKRVGRRNRRSPTMSSGRKDRSSSTASFTMSRGTRARSRCGTARRARSSTTRPGAATTGWR